MRKIDAWSSRGQRPSITKRLVCLANSHKPGGRCVAGRELGGGGWVRPVSGGADPSVSTDAIAYRNGRQPKLLDVMDVPLLEPTSSGHQRENWLLDPARRWVKVGTLPWRSLASLQDPEAPLWDDGFSSSTGLNNRVPEDRARHLADSLRLVHAPDLQIEVFENRGHIRVHGRFVHAGVEHNLSVTDPECSRIFRLKDDGEYAVGDSYLTISLGGVFKDRFCYKLIAAVFQAGSAAGRDAGRGALHGGPR